MTTWKTTWRSITGSTSWRHASRRSRKRSSEELILASSPGRDHCELASRTSRVSNRRHSSSVNFGGAIDFWPKIRYEKLTKCPNFLWYLPEIYQQIYFPNLRGVCPKMLEFYTIIVRRVFSRWGGTPSAPVAYAYVTNNCNDNVERALKTVRPSFAFFARSKNGKGWPYPCYGVQAGCSIISNCEVMPY